MAFAPAAATGIIDAIAAAQRGQCEAVLAYKSNKWKRGRPPGAPERAQGRIRVGGLQQFTLPYGHAMTSQWLALWAMRHFHVYGTRHEHLGQIAVTSRRHAGLNPRAVLRDPITLAEAEERATAFLADAGLADLQVGEVMQFDNHFYVAVVDPVTGEAPSSCSSASTGSGSTSSPARR